MAKTILVTGATGQIGSDLIKELSKRYEGTQIIASSRKANSSTEIKREQGTTALSIRRKPPNPCLGNRVLDRDLNPCPTQSSYKDEASNPSFGRENVDESCRRLRTTNPVSDRQPELLPVDRSLFPRPQVGESLVHEVLDVTDSQRLQEIIEWYRVDTIYHLAGILSAKGERNRELCWNVNINGLKNVLEAARTYRLKVFCPSSIAVFGANTPKFKTPQTTIKEPSTIYGITKATGELLCQYYAHQFGVDVRSLRLPGIISHGTPPGGGTTDFAVEIFYRAIEKGSYTCFVRPETRLPMMYMPDAIEAILKLMQAESAAIKVRSSYNIAAVSFSAAELVAEIQKHLPDFTCYYQPDFRQAIADSWPSIIDDSQARADWGWQHSYDLRAIVADMLEHLSPRLPKEEKCYL